MVCRKNLLFVLGAIVVFFSSCLSDTEQFIFGGQEVGRDELLADSFSVTLNPHGIAPLTASIQFTTKIPCRVEVDVTGTQPLSKSYDSLLLVHEVPVIGLYPASNNNVIIRIIDEKSNYYQTSLSITTGEIPDYLPTIDVKVSNAGEAEPGWTLSEIGIGTGSDFRAIPIMYDQNGVIRWYMDLESLGGLVFPVKRLNNGNLIIPRGSFLYEYTWNGKRVNSWNMPGNIQHHEVLEKPNGNFIVAVDREMLATVEDHIVEVDRESGNIVNQWDMRQVLDIDRFDLVNDPVDWFHMNAIYYDERDESLIVSGRNQGIIKVSKNNLLVWILAPHKGWGRAGLDGLGHETSDFLLTAIDENGNPFDDSIQLGLEKAEEFDWSWGQHTPMILPDGHIFVFDNGFSRLFSTDTDQPYSRGVEYAIDEENNTIRQVNQYGRERGLEMFSPIISDVDYLPVTTNRLIAAGICESDPGPGYARVVEVKWPEMEVVFEATLQFKNQFTNGSLAWGDLDLSYRSERIDLND